jgi:myo-inositol-1(or 4)-monophosphatase
MNPVLADLEAMARQAGEILRTAYRQGVAVFRKGEIDLVTEADHQSEDYLLGEIGRRFPGHAIVSEESGQIAGEDCCVWYIDPLDGTVNFAHGVPIFTVSIGFAANGQMHLGVIYDPLRDECFSAEAGRGAWLNGLPIHASDVEQLGQSLVVTGFPYDVRTNPANNLDLYARFTMSAQGVRRLGSAALDLSYVAAGRFDGYWEIRLSPWDLAAGALIAREAGALVTTLSGDAELLKPPYGILACSPKIHSQMLAVIHA